MTKLVLSPRHYLRPLPTELTELERNMTFLLNPLEYEYQVGTPDIIDRKSRRP